MAYIGNQPFTTAFLTDQFSGTGSQTAFTLSAAPASTSSIIVAVTGVLQDPSTYSVVGTTLNFSAAPPSGTGNISVRFLGIPASGVTTTAYRTLTEFTATAGQTTFTPPSYTVGYINVFRNGVRLGTADYTASNGTTVVLVNPASAGDLVATESFYVSSVLNAIPGTAGSVGTTYLVNSSVTQAKLASGVAGNGPAFSASQTAGQSLSAATWTKVQFSVENFDTASCYDTSNYRFTPNVAGYYQVNAVIETNASSSGAAAIYKNGSVFRRAYASNPGVGATSFVAALVYLNGSTDYVEAYVRTNNATSLYTSAEDYEFSASMVRAA